MCNNKYYARIMFEVALLRAVINQMSRVFTLARTAHCGTSKLP